MLQFSNLNEYHTVTIYVTTVIIKELQTCI